MQLNEELDEKAIERIVDSAVTRIERALEKLDVSMDYVAALLGDEDPYDIGARQGTLGRAALRTRHVRPEPSRESE